MTMTTLNAIRAASPCHDGWTKLLKHLGKTSADDEPLPLLTVLDSNGIDDALWVLDNTKCDPRLSRHFGAWHGALIQLSHEHMPKWPKEFVIFSAPAAFWLLQSDAFSKLPQVHR